MDRIRAAAPEDARAIAEIHVGGWQAFYRGLVPVGTDIFRGIVIRVSYVPLVETVNFNLTQWTDTAIYEVCTNPAVYTALEKKRAAEK